MLQAARAINMVANRDLKAVRADHLPDASKMVGGVD
jgi:hypothetical protein